MGTNKHELKNNNNKQHKSYGHTETQSTHFKAYSSRKNVNHVGTNKDLKKQQKSYRHTQANKKQITNKNRHKSQKQENSNVTLR